MKTLVLYEVEVETTNCLHNTWVSAAGVYLDCKNDTAYVASESHMDMVEFVGKSLRKMRCMGPVVVVQDAEEVPHAD